MQKLIVFNSVSLDGYFVDGNGRMDWAHNPIPDEEWDAFGRENAKGGGTLVFGRVTYEMMAGYWPTPAAAKANPVLAERMNKHTKIVFSRTLERAGWSNTRLLKGDLAQDVRSLKAEPGEGLAILGSGSLVTQLTREQLIDKYQFAVVPVILGKGRTMFEGLEEPVNLKLIDARAFKNGNVVLTYEPAH